MLHGTHQRGERNRSVKLTEPLVKEIRAKYASGGITHAELASLYGISLANTSFILTRKTWKHI